MLFNSLEFALFLLIVFLIYWYITDKNLKARNSFLLFASYFFYGWWDIRFLLLLVFISLSNYLFGIIIEKNEKNKKLYLAAILIINIGTLGIFKYYNFFVDSFIGLLSLTGYKLPHSTTQIILPLGISFYIFLSLSYILDIYKKTISANRNIVDVLLSLSFFPIILAGPIQRPSDLQIQIARRREFDCAKATDGLKQILWGLFVKITIADNIASYCDNIFLNYSGYSGSTLLLGIILYSVQIYADFSGYSNIAIGTARLFGFDLMKNFAYPYFSRDLTEFWKRWHISLTTWFRDYVYLPLSVNISWKIDAEKVLYIKTDMFIYIVASIVTWFVTGLWHGPNYTFIVWGMIHCFFLIIYQWQRKPRQRLLRKYGISNDNRLIAGMEILLTLCIVMVSWIFFRSVSIGQALHYIGGMFSFSLFTMPEVFPLKVIGLSFIFIFSEWLQRDKEHALQIESIRYRFLKWGIYYGIAILIILTLDECQQSFIYSHF